MRGILLYSHCRHDNYILTFKQKNIMLEELTLWYSALGMPEKIYWTIAIVASAIFVIQTILTFVGIDMHGDFDLPHDTTMDAGGFASLFSVRSFINFMVGFGWAGVTFTPGIPSVWLVLLLSVIVGLVFAYMYMFLLKRMRGLEANGAISAADTVGLRASVYLRIPANCEGKGKVQVTVNGSLREFDAMTRGESIPTGAQVTVVGESAGCLIVEA